ncbi:MAG TPA: peptide deformylase [Polyangiaceae bacterium]|nr:peptide deformylase [Polyangiaceae bacterium]
MTPPIVQAGDPVLRRPASPVDPGQIGGAAFRELVDRMVEAMRAAPGVGLAAPQIGVPWRVLVVEDTEERMAALSPEARALRGRRPVPLRVVVNPELEVVGPRRATFFEGCLSVRGYAALVERAHEVVVRGLDGEGRPLVWQAEGWPARILQHEVDHLDGTLYVDRMLTRSLCQDGELKRWSGRGVDEVLAELVDAAALRPR